MVSKNQRTSTADASQVTHKSCRLHWLLLILLLLLWVGQSTCTFSSRQTDSAWGLLLLEYIAPGTAGPTSGKTLTYHGNGEITKTLGFSFMYSPHLQDDQLEEIVACKANKIPSCGEFFFQGIDSPQRVGAF